MILAAAMTTLTGMRRFACLSFSSTMAGKDVSAAAIFLPTITTTRSDIPMPARRTFFTSTRPRLMAAAPGVQVSDPSLIQQALTHRHVTVVDVRGIDEIQANGYWKVKQQKRQGDNDSTSATAVQWIHAPCTLDACPLLSVASESLLPDKSAPVILYCASGKRATKAQQVLIRLGYTNVLNAGGFPSDTDKIIQFQD
jgi:rhodanese-related sulfurtransferase